MKILIIASTKDVFGKELKNELFIKGLDVYLLDFETLEMFDKNNSEDKKYSKLLEKFKNISKFSMLFRLWYIKSIIKENNFDIINIHVSRWFYLIILPWLIKQKLVITFYGSDFYRTSNFIKNIQKLLYKKAHIITFTNPLTKNSFIEYYKDFKNKSYVCRFGLKTLEFIDKNRDINKKELRKYLGYDLEKIIVTCGYNSTKEQQHEKIINNLIKLQKEILEKVQFVFPMTYGDIIHKEKIKSILNQTNLDYIVLEEFLYREDNANIKLASDIMINILETDSFSGSMQEFLYANNIIITGAWLPYEVFDNAGIQYVKIDDINELYLELKKIIDSDIQTFDISKNKNIISKLSLWNNTIESWVDAYTK
ncbi:glycosyltransferase [Aliarcobacter butzleri]|uniref:glycosyltransferase n=1 Tax=Aliarcobacter butzleri TaxID=28197 RepID=UPI002B24222A|nr:glycosyltransferase [Aliarcobacter butzleri]